MDLSLSFPGRTPDKIIAIAAHVRMLCRPGPRPDAGTFSARRRIAPNVFLTVLEPPTFHFLSWPHLSHLLYISLGFLIFVMGNVRFCTAHCATMAQCPSGNFAGC